MGVTYAPVRYQHKVEDAVRILNELKAKGLVDSTTVSPVAWNAKVFAGSLLRKAGRRFPQSPAEIAGLICDLDGAQRGN